MLPDKSTPPDMPPPQVLVARRTPPAGPIPEAYGLEGTWRLLHRKLEESPRVVQDTLVLSVEGRGVFLLVVRRDNKGESHQLTWAGGVRMAGNPDAQNGRLVAE